MDRRGFLSTTFVGGLAATTGACANGPRGEVAAPPLGDDELERKLARLDRNLERMNHKRATRWYLKHHEGAEDQVSAD